MKPTTKVAESPEAITRVGCSTDILSTAFYSDKRWFKAASLLRSDPGLMTNKILILALKNGAPVHVIKFMLSMNPKAAGIPKEGPTPLQVAVQHNASVEVVRAVVEACPFALVVTTNPEWLDPLTYARRFRGDETKLIELLSRPLGSWLHPSERDKDKNSSIPIQPEPLRKPPSQPDISSPPSMSYLPKKHKHPADESLEIENVKQLCLTVLKGQRRLSREVLRVKESISQNISVPSILGLSVEEDSLPSSALLSEDCIEKLKDVEETQKRNFKAQLIALDMKEQAMRAYVRRMEASIKQAMSASKPEKMAKRCEDTVKGLKDQIRITARCVDDFANLFDTRMSELEVNLDQETQRNAYFRGGVQHKLDMDRYHSEGVEVVRRGDRTPFVFATPYLDEAVEAREPLWPKPEDGFKEKQPLACQWPLLWLRRRDVAPMEEKSCRILV